MTQLGAQLHLVFIAIPWVEAVYERPLPARPARSMASETEVESESGRRWRLEQERQEAAHRAKVSRDAVNATQRLPNAVRRGDAAAVEALLKKGADCAAVASTTGSLVKLAEDNGRQQVATLLRQKQIR